MDLVRSSQRPVALQPAVRAGLDPVIVLVESARRDAEVIEWAAVEAAARGSELRIVHAFRWPYLLDAFGYATIDLEARGDAEAVVVAAAVKARQVAPSVRITTTVHVGGTSAALIKEARKSRRALVVVGRTAGRDRLLRRLARRTTASVALVVGPGSDDVVRLGSAA